MTRLQFFLCCVLAVAVGCTKDATFTEPEPPQAALHWIHAVPDTGEMDMRPVDIISNAGLFDAVFRGSNMFYQGMEAGTRQIRVFMSSTNPAITGVPILDTTATFASPNSYTIIHTGFARTGSTPGRVLWIVPDAGADPGANNIGIRLLHAGVGMAAVDVNVTRHATDTLPDAPAVANLAYKGIGTYFTLVHDSLAADSLRVVVTATGTKTPVLFSVKIPRGIAGTLTSNPIAGASVAGSVITAVIVPASVVGSTAPQGGAFAAPSAVFLVDRRPANTIPTPP
ncbi:MAG: hypothetical protein AUH41_07455 [Gemmatimonadetes bacterium 13_1_40CM_66_11]|nr:MAG: hypothetical protein AUH41_07455 [Gemmatimonadetes bacterium 13_1_40CM_66_11]